MTWRAIAAPPPCSSLDREWIASDSFATEASSCPRARSIAKAGLSATAGSRDSTGAAARIAFTDGIGQES